MSTTAAPTRFNLTMTAEGEGSVSFVHDGAMKTITSEDNNFARICEALANGENVTPLLSTAVVFEALDARVAVTGESLLFDGIPVRSDLASTIARYNAEGRDTRGLVRFLERLVANPSPASQSNLFDWLEARDLTIDREGYIVAFKGVSVLARPGDRDPFDLDAEAEEDRLMTEVTVYQSTTGGHAYVNGVEYNGYIPQRVGDVVSMPREEVDDNTGAACSTGLHIGTYSFAKGFGGNLIEVRIDPADVVSVPHDSHGAKMRCCRYEILAAHEGNGYTSLRRDHEPPATYTEDTAEASLVALAPEKESWVKRLFGRRSGAQDEG